jgi:hypothetical protein
MIGVGVGKPMGLPNAGIPIREVSPATQPEQFTWQDLVMLKYELPMQWHCERALSDESAHLRLAADYE